MPAGSHSSQSRSPNTVTGVVGGAHLEDTPQDRPPQAAPAPAAKLAEERVERVVKEVGAVSHRQISFDRYW